MRRTSIIATAIIIVISIAVIWGPTLLAVHSPKHLDAAPASSVEVMKMMIEARDLPEQTYPAH